MNQTTQLVQEKVLREFNMYGIVNEKMSLTFREFVGTITDMEKQNYMINPAHKPEPIFINLNTPGGSCVEGSAILSAIRDLKGYGIKVHIHLEGQCCSFGIPLAVAGDVRTADNLVSLMIHGASMSPGYDYISKTQRLLNFEEIMCAKVDRFIIENSKITQELLDEYAEKEYWFTYDEALELGILTEDIFEEEEVSPIEESLAIINSMKKSEVITYLTQAKESLSTRLESENKKKTKDKVLINVLKESIENIEMLFEVLSEVAKTEELGEIYSILIWNAISVFIEDELEGDADEE